MTIQVNTDPAMSEVEFLRSVIRQIAHICGCTEEQGAFGLTAGDAVEKIKDVVIVANERPSSDDDIIRTLRRQVGDGRTNLLDHSLLTKQIGVAHAAMAGYQQEIETLRAQRNTQTDMIQDLRNRASNHGPRLATDDAFWLAWLARQLRFYETGGGKLDIKIPQVVAKLRYLAKALSGGSVTLDNDD